MTLATVDDTLVTAGRRKKGTKAAQFGCNRNATFLAVAGYPGCCNAIVIVCVYSARLAAFAAAALTTHRRLGVKSTQEQSAAAKVAMAGRGSVIAAGAAEDVVVLTLDGHGMVCDCNRACEDLFKYHRSELVWRHVSMLLPQLAELALMQNGQPNPHLRFLCRIGRHFLAVTQDGERFASEVFLNVLDGTGRGRLSLIVRPAEETAGASGLCATLRQGKSKGKLR